MKARSVKARSVKERNRMKLSQKDFAAIETLLKRKPTLVETYIFDTMWSEHCSYKSSKSTLKKYLKTTGKDVILGIGEDAGVIFFTEHNGKRYGIVMAHESHNHPSQILPIEGAATGVGGVVRDVYCMGADVFGVLNSIHFGQDPAGHNPLVDEIAREVVIGISDYANPLGVPVLGGETIFHPSYNDNCLVNVAALGIIEADDVIHSFVPEQAKSEPYDVILFGKSTDATGFGGASFSSATLDTANQTANIGAVQVHDPFLKRVMVEGIKHLLHVIKEKKVPVGFKDLGAGGISCATSEIAAASGFGVDVDLDKVNVAFSGLPPEVIACSETQERFCLTVPQWFTPTVLEIFNKTYELPAIYPGAGAVVIGKVIEKPVFKLSHGNKVVCELPIGAITHEVKADRIASPKTIKRQADDNALPNVDAELDSICRKLTGSKFNASKRFVYRFFDNAVRGDTVIYPGEGDGVVITPVEGCDVAVTVSMDSNIYGAVDPYVSGAAAVAESVRNVIAVGGKPIAITDCLNYGNPEKPDVFFDFQEGVRGIADAARELSFIENESIPIVSGNVSLYNESKQGNAVVPSPVIMTVGRVSHYKNALTMQLVSPNETLILIGGRYPEFGATQIATIIPGLNTVAPQLRFKEEDAANKLVYRWIEARLLTACHDISAGGLWQAVTEMVLGERGLAKVGAELHIPGNVPTITTLFSENGGYVISINTTHQDRILADLSKAGIPHHILGKTTAERSITLHKTGKEVLRITADTLSRTWNAHNPEYQ